jgi:hypothetical protein
VREIIAALLGRASSTEVIVVTDRGVELPLSHAKGWTVLDVSRLLAQIERWPDTEERT